MIVREAQRKKWRRINWTTRKERARSVVKIQLPDEVAGDGTIPGEVFDTEEDAFNVMSELLVKRFTGAFSAPCYHGRLFDDFGFTGDTEEAADLLEGKYVFPEGTDPATKLLFEEASKMYLNMSSEEVQTYVTLDKYKYYWRRVKD